MKKIPTVFVKEYKDHKVVGIKNEFTSEETKYAFEHGLPTVKWDGACCAIIDGELYKRYDAKKGKTPPAGAIPCCEADPITGHHPHWVKCDEDNPSDKWFIMAFTISSKIHIGDLPDGTYEAVGTHFNGNPYGMGCDVLLGHGGARAYDVPRDFEGIKDYLKDFSGEGLVYWVNDEPVAKIKRSDFGYPWNAECFRVLCHKLVKSLKEADEE